MCLFQTVLYAKNIFLCRPREISNHIEGIIDQMVFLKSVKGILVVISPGFIRWHYLCRKESQIQFLILATLLAWKCMGGSSESRHQNGGQRLQGSKWQWGQPGESPFNPALHYSAEKSPPRSSGPFGLCFKDSISSSLCACSLSPQLCMLKLHIPCGQP